MLKALDAALPTMGPAPGLTDEQIAIQRWQIYLTTLFLEVALASCVLAKRGFPRGMTILNRSIYEYVTKLEFFSANPAIALEQFVTVPIRNYALMEKVAANKDEVAQRMGDAYDAWRAANADLDEFSGNRSLLNMNLAVTKPERILVDKRNAKIKYTVEHKALHDIPSQVVHGEGVMMFDVFDDLDDPANFNARLHSTIFTVIRELSKLVTLLNKFLLIVYENGTDIASILELTNAMTAFRERADKMA